MAHNGVASCVALAVLVSSGSAQVRPPNDSAASNPPPADSALPFQPPADSALPFQPDRYPPPRPCLLDSADCMALDPRPFEVCLLALNRCPSEAEMLPLPGSTETGR